MERIDAVDHLRAHFNDKTANDGFIDGRIDGHGFADTFGQRLGQFFRLGFGQRLGRGHVSGHFAAGIRQHLAQNGEQLRHHKQATLLRHQCQRILQHRGKFHLV